MATRDESGRRFTQEWSEDLVLSDGTPISLRLLHPEDRSTLIAAFKKLSPESRYLRFFTAMPRLPKQVLDRLMLDDEDHVAIVALGASEGATAPEGYGVARFTRLSDTPDTAEAAVTVVDHMQRRGIGTLLLTRLVDAARERGITCFRVEVLRGNSGVNALLRELDADAQPDELDGAVAVYRVALSKEPSGTLFRLLGLAAKGIEVGIRHLPAFWRDSDSEDASD